MEHFPQRSGILACSLKQLPLKLKSAHSTIFYIRMRVNAPSCVCDFDVMKRYSRMLCALYRCIARQKLTILFFSSSCLFCQMAKRSKRFSLLNRTCKKWNVLHKNKNAHMHSRTDKIIYAHNIYFRTWPILSDIEWDYDNFDGIYVNPFNDKFYHLCIVPRKCIFV